MDEKETSKACEDPIVAEVRAVRDSIAKKFNYDVDALCDHYIAKQKENEKRGVKYVSLPPKRLPVRTGTDS